MTTDTPQNDLIKEAKIIKLTKQNYHELAKSKEAWYETMKSIINIYEETDTRREKAT